MTRKTRVGLLGTLLAAAVIAYSAVIGTENAPVLAILICLVSCVLYMFDD